MGEGGDHVLDGVADGVGVFVVHLPGVAHEAVGLLLMDRLCSLCFLNLRLLSSFHFAASHPVCIGIQASLTAVHLFNNPLACVFACAANDLACTHSLTLLLHLSALQCVNTRRRYSQTLPTRLLKCRGGRNKVVPV